MSSRKPPTCATCALATDRVKLAARGLLAETVPRKGPGRRKRRFV